MKHDDDKQQQAGSVAGKQRVVVVGGGFGGINLIQRLDKRKFDVTLIDRNNYHSFPPLFYQVASGGLEPGSISFPFRREIRRRKVRGVRYRMGDVGSIDYDRRIVNTDNGTVPYDILVIAAGTTNNYFGNDQLAGKVFTLKSTPEALRCRDEILSRLEMAAGAGSDEERRRLLSFVVVGGGPAGVEIAGALGEVKRWVIRREYPELRPELMSVTLVEGGRRLLGAMSAGSGDKALSYLKRLMVGVELGKVMKSYDSDRGRMIFGDGSELDAGMVIWTAGVTACTFAPAAEGSREPGRGHGNRIIVDGYCRVAGFEGVYAIGDIAVSVTDSTPSGHPQLAQVAIQQARHLARNLNSGRFTTPFRYDDKGTMATVGRNMAVVEIGKLHYGGLAAWLSWMLIHLVSLLGARNRLNVFIDWIWAYFTFNSSLRLMFRPLRRRSGPVGRNSGDFGQK